MLQDTDLLSIQEVRTKVDKAYAAFQEFRKFSQEQVDAIVEDMAAAARAEAHRLAEFAVEETRYGNVASKVAKNLLCADLLPRRIRGMKTISSSPGATSTAVSLGFAGVDSGSDGFGGSCAAASFVRTRSMTGGFPCEVPVLLCDKWSRSVPASPASKKPWTIQPLDSCGGLK